MPNLFQNRQIELFEKTDSPKYKSPERRRHTGDAVEHYTRAQLAADCGIRTSPSPELSRHDLIAEVPIRFKIGDCYINASKHLSIQVRGQETNSGNFNFYGYEPHEFDIAAYGSKQAVAFYGGVPNKSSLSISNSLLLNPQYTKMSWESAVNTHLQTWVNIIQHPEFEGVFYDPLV